MTDWRKVPQRMSADLITKLREAALAPDQEEEGAASEELYSRWKEETDRLIGQSAMIGNHQTREDRVKAERERQLALARVWNDRETQRLSKSWGESFD